MEDKREIKFRVWDTRNQNWYHKLIEWAFDRPKGSVGQLPEMPKDTILTQYTGLKDGTKWEQLSKEEQDSWIDSEKTKEEWNGKDIYEGDILYFEESDDCSEVEWQQILDHETEMGYGEGWDLTGTETAKIIGNIYENPELLRGKI